MSSIIATRVLLQMGAGATRLAMPQINTNRCFCSLGLSRALTGPGRVASSLVRLQRRTTSTIPEDFDADAELSGPPGAAKVETVPENPFLESTTSGLEDSATDWSRSYHGLSQMPFDKGIAEILLAPVDPADVEIKPGRGTLSHVCEVLLCYRRPHLSSGNKIPSYFESCIWARRLGPCATQRNQC